MIAQAIKEKVTRKPTTPAHPAVPDAVRRFAARHDPRREPPFTLWHAVGVLLFAAVVLVAQYGPGLAAELGHWPVTDWQTGVKVRMGALLLIAWALFGVRAMNPLTACALWGASVVAVMRIGDARMTHHSIGAAEVLLFAVFAAFAVRVITRIPDYTTDDAQSDRGTHDGT